MTNMTCFRFNMDNPEYARAWEHLHNVDKDRDKSANYVAVKAINEYFDRRARLEDDPYFENRQREERFVEQIVSEVGKALTAEMPKFLASFMMNLNASYTVNPPIQPIADENDDFSAIDMDFIGG